MPKKNKNISFTKSDLVKEICNEYKDLTNAQAKFVVNCIFNSISSFLSEKKRVEIRGFGSFGLKKYRARDGKNPQTGEVIQIQSKTLPFFKVGKFKQEIAVKN